ncbi:hypothetical protein DRJ17_05435 [Candidatus Woesearchaeota archaeon]|nr:MAG: hypothetical protein DRJ17_05435 [Candidatus Woesearchaeota archaeon]
MADVRKEKLGEDISKTVEKVCLGLLNVRGKSVLIKPNVNSDDVYPGTTNPVIVRALVNLCFKKGAEKVIVGDKSSIFWPNSKGNMRKIGLTKAMEGSKAELKVFDKFVKVAVDGKYLKSLRAAKDVLDADCVIGVPVCHTHVLAVISMSLKLWMGAVTRRDRVVFHAGKLQEKIAEMNLVFKPMFCLLDASKVMISGGPDKGVVREGKMLFASRSRVALDIEGARFIQKLGGLRNVDIANIKQISYAKELGIK